MDTERIFPGELAPLPMRWGGAPVTEDEAVGVARRLAQRAAEEGRVRSAMGPIDELPASDARPVQSAHRLSPRLLHLARARAEMEQRTVTSVIEEALTAYAAGRPGSVATYVLPDGPEAHVPTVPARRKPGPRPAAG